MAIYAIKPVSKQLIDDRAVDRRPRFPAEGVVAGGHQLGEQDHAQFFLGRAEEGGRGRAAPVEFAGGGRSPAPPSGRAARKVQAEANAMQRRRA